MAAVMLADLLRSRELAMWKWTPPALRPFPGQPASEEARQVMEELGLDLGAPGQASDGRTGIRGRSHPDDDCGPQAGRGGFDRGCAGVHPGEFAGSDEELADPFGQGIDAYRSAAGKIRELLMKALDRLENFWKREKDESCCWVRSCRRR